MVSYYVESIENGEEKKKRERGSKQKRTTNHRQASLEPPEKNSVQHQGETHTHMHAA